MDILNITVIALSLIVLLWLPFRIVGVWRGNRAIPPIPFRPRGYEITRRNFPALGMAVFSIAGAIFMSRVNMVLISNAYLGKIDVLFLALIIFAGLLGIMGVLFAIMTVTIGWFERPRFLIPPSLREKGG